jgi:DNA-binding MarR family transcriptional regulator
MQAVEGLRESLAGQLRISLTGFQALAVLADGELTPKELSARLGLTTGSVTPLVNHLVQSGYVVREPHPADRRSVMLWLTPAGRHAYGWIHDTYQRAVREALAGDPDATAVAVGIIGRIAGAIEDATAAQPHS